MRTVSYDRGFSLTDTWAEPVFSDSATAGVGGFIAPRTQLQFSGRALFGGGVSGSYGDIQTMNGSGELSFARVTACQHGADVRLLPSCSWLTMSPLCRAFAHDYRRTVHSPVRERVGSAVSTCEETLMLPGKIYRPEDYVEILWRRKWLGIVPFVVVARRDRDWDAVSARTGTDRMLGS